MMTMPIKELVNILSSLMCEEEGAKRDGFVSSEQAKAYNRAVQDVYENIKGHFKDSHK